MNYTTEGFNGTTLLHVAACEGKTDCIPVLLRHGADVEAHLAKAGSAGAAARARATG